MQRRNLLAAAAAMPLARGFGVVAGRSVVLELFTSQGCSSCPPADALLGELVRGRAGVVGLAWHVDYWDGLGWRDPYSSRVATERQRAYASRLGTEVFTPGLVVNGGTMLVGSDRSAVERAVAETPALPVVAVLRRSPEGVSAQVGAGRGPVSALVAMWDPSDETRIGAGENGGRRLREYRVVRGVRELGSWDGVAREFAVPAIAAGQGATLLVQGADLRVLGAAELEPA
ncbi:MAG TPA: DUF1223 domain-containing protein [Acetobacteraceae bacterium]